MNFNEQQIKSNLQRITDTLLINGGFLDNSGLYTGEMGLVLFFFHYARFTQNELFSDYGFELIEKVQNRIHEGTLINYQDGLTGIGSTIEYLVQNGFIEADTDDILEDFDKRIFFTCNLSRLPIEEIKDVGYYAAWRISGNSKHKDMIRQDVQQYTDIPNLRLKKHTCLVEKSFSHCLELIDQNKFWNKDFGFQNGLASWGMFLLTELNGDNSWISLLANDFIPLKNESLPV